MFPVLPDKHEENPPEEIRNEGAVRDKISNILCSYHHPPYVLERKLIAFIKQGDSAGSEETLRQINQLERATLADSQLRSVKNSLIGSCTMFTRAVIEVGVDSESAFSLSDRCIRAIETFATVAQTENFEYEMLRQFLALLHGSGQNQYSPTVSRAITCIKQNVQHKLVLTNIAKTAGVHPNYLSAMFHKEVGISIAAFIEQQRAEAIRLFLLETTMSLTDIAYTFEFSSVAYFSGFFKKHFGISPLKYRQMHGSKE